MNHEKILWKVLETFQTCNVKSFPINCYDLLEQHGYECIEYSELETDKQNACFCVSDDAFRINHTIFYNDHALFCRSRFSLMHELGHIVLNHKAPCTEQNEAEANFFASNILAPRIAIYYAKCLNANDVAQKFKLTYTAASYAFDDYRKWRRKAIHHMSNYDKLMYQHFYSSTLNCFIWNIHTCRECKCNLYNTLDEVCDECRTGQVPSYDFMPYAYNTYEVDKDFLIAEYHYLYGYDL